MQKSLENSQSKSDHITESFILDDTKTSESLSKKFPTNIEL